MLKEEAVPDKLDAKEKWMPEKTPTLIRPLQDVAAALGIKPEYGEPYGRHKVKIDVSDDGVITGIMG